ncbi:MAG: coenzyme F420-0:L-glutamate ligase [Candidatus Wildermuthbacteria bacterium]|nr:coenzyme F420-0:L-glutamate ligase [Candidatus Wildermuthbacteria bacterium]
MKVAPVKTRKITPKDKDIFAILKKYLAGRLHEGCVVAVTSKIVSICEGRVALIQGNDKIKLAMKEADLYYPLSKSKYQVLLTIKNHRIGFTSGIDESNGAGYLVLWPLNPQKSANQIRSFLAKEFKLKKVGVVITDTTSSPLLRGQRGMFIAHSGFSALNSYINQPDIFGRKLKMTRSAVADALSTAAVLVMGEGKEQTPLAVIENVPFVKFQQRNPTSFELREIRMEPKDDLYAPLLKAVKWKKGEHTP